MAKSSEYAKSLDHIREAIIEVPEFQQIEILRTNLSIQGT